jgi:hypothetical protein
MGEPVSVPSDDETVGELRALLRRTQAALAESDRADLVEKACVVIWPEGDVSIYFAEHRRSTEPTVEKAISLDPVFQVAP